MNNQSKPSIFTGFRVGASVLVWGFACAALSGCSGARPDFSETSSDESTKDASTGAGSNTTSSASNTGADTQDSAAAEPSKGDDKPAADKGEPTPSHGEGDQDAQSSEPASDDVSPGGGCTPDTKRACQGVMGNCADGFETCSASGKWGPCDVQPRTDNCEPKDDGDCDGEPNEGCDCTTDDRRPCQGAEGSCAEGEEVCADGQWGDCTIQPAASDRCDVPGNDDNCDGSPNGGCVCENDATQYCGSTTDEGECQRGTSTCSNQAWGECSGSIAPAARDCRSDKDNDCDGKPDNTSDDTCECVPDDEEDCETHPGQDGKGICQAGTRICVADNDFGSSHWGDCEDFVGPAPRDCNSTADNDCDGQPDNSGSSCACAEGETLPCAARPASGGCETGVQHCMVAANGTSSTWGACEYENLPDGDDCDDGNDDDIKGACKAGKCDCPANHSMCDDREGCIPDDQCCVDDDCDDHFECSNTGECTCAEQCCADTDCSASLPACVGNHCVACADDADCPLVGTARCNTQTNTCAACTDDTQCAHLDGTAVCDAGLCVQCNGSNESACGSYVCDVPNKVCAPAQTKYNKHAADVCDECVSDTQCMNGQVCVTTHFSSWADQSSVTVPGYFCQYEPGKSGAPSQCDAANSRPYLDTQAGITTVNGRTQVTVCQLRYSSCPAQAFQYDANSKSCATSGADPTDCGDSPYQDTVCNPNGQCASRCSMTEDCIAGSDHDECFAISGFPYFCY